MLFSVASRNWIETSSAHWRPRTIEVHELALKHVAPTFGKMLLTDICADDIARYQLSRRRDKASPRTINIEVTTLRSVMIKHRLWGKLGPDVRMLKEPESIGRALTPEEQHELLVQCRISRNRALYPIAEVALNTGLRSDEIRQLSWTQVDFDKLTLQVRHSKTAHGENRVVPINSRLVHVLQLWADRFPRRKPQHYVFPFELSGAGGKVDAFGFVGPCS